VHIYVINNFKRIPLLLNVEKVLVRGFMNNFITLILKSLMEYGGLIVEHVANSVYCGLDGLAMFINMHKCVPIELRFKFAPFMTTLHYMPN
jgi:hypothetical protein